MTRFVIGLDTASNLPLHLWLVKPILQTRTFYLVHVNGCLLFSIYWIAARIKLATTPWLLRTFR